MRKSDLVEHDGAIYSLTDLAQYMPEESREALHSEWAGADDDHAGWWAEYVERYPQDAASAASLAPTLGIVAEAQAIARRALSGRDGAAGDWRQAGYASALEAARVIVGCNGRADDEWAARIVAASLE